MRKKSLLFLFAFNYCCAQLPDTDLWLFHLKKEKDIYKIEKGSNITKRPGYDNQPSFSDDNKKIYYVSIREDKQADIYLYNIAKKNAVQLTRTSESEYSPNYIKYNNSLNCVVVEKDSAQRIWLYDEKTGLPKKILMDEDSVGYYSFLNQDTVLYYKLTHPHSLRAFSIRDKKDVFIAENPVRGFKAINRHEFIFGIKDSVKVTFYRYNTLVRKAFEYCSYNSLNEDILWHQQLGLLKSEDALILRYDETEKNWKTLFDLSSYGIKKITRFVFDHKNRKLVIADNQ